MVEVTVAGGHTAAREDAGPVAGFDVASLPAVGPPPRSSLVERHPGVGVGDGPSPLGLVLLGGDLAGEVGDDRPVPGQFSGILGQSDERGQVDVEIDGSPFVAPATVAAFEEVEENVGAELVDGAVLVAGFELQGEPVDPAADGDGPVGREVESTELGGPVGIGFEDHPALLNCHLVSSLSVVGIHRHA
jgi:hypothetical protein